MSVFGVILVRIFPHSNWIRIDTIQSECGKIRTRITPNTDTFHEVDANDINPNTNALSMSHFTITRSNRQEMFCKKGVLRNFTKFTGIHLCQGLFFNKVAGLWHRCFPMNFCEISKNTFIYRAPPVAASIAITQECFV